MQKSVTEINFLKCENELFFLVFRYIKLNIFVFGLLVGQSKVFDEVTLDIMFYRPDN